MSARHIAEIACRLDGLKNGPIELGSCDSNNWLKIAATAVEQRIATLNCSGKETSFSLMLITKDKCRVIEDRVAQLTESVNADPHSTASVAFVGDIEYLRAQLADLKDVKEHQRKENVRRKHNYVPFIVELLREMAVKRSNRDS